MFGLMGVMIMADFVLWLFDLIPDLVDLCMPIFALGMVLSTAHLTYYLLGVYNND